MTTDVDNIVLNYFAKRSINFKIQIEICIFDNKPA